MQHILVYADSLSWGIIPGTRKRLQFPERWPGVMELELRRQQVDVRVIEDCLNGRRTQWEDPIKPGRNGLIGIEQRIEVNSPLALVIIMLGTNDFQSMHDNSADDSALGIRRIVEAIRRAPIEPGMDLPQITLVAPPAIQPTSGTLATGPIAEKFANAEMKSKGLNDAIEKIAVEMDCVFFDAGSVTRSSRVDGVHLDKDQHKLLGTSIAQRIMPLIRQPS